MLVLRAPVAKTLPVVVKFWHAVAGLYFWEFVTTLGYEWKVIRGHLPYRWTIWVHSLTRVATFLSLTLLLVCMDLSTPENCKLTPKFQFAFTYLAFASASLLLLLRIIAIWNYKKPVVWIAICLWVTNVAFFLQGIIRVGFVWLPDERACVASNVNGIKLTLTVTLIIDTVLLVTVLVGLLRLRRDGGGKFGLQGLLWKQCVVWLILGALAEIPPVVLILLDMSVDTNLLLQFPSLVVMSVAATRMHRSLVDYASGSLEIASDTLRKDAFPVSKTKRTAAIQITLNKVEVSMPSTDAQHLGSQSSQRDSCISTDGPRCVLQNGLIINRDLESGMDKSVQ